MLDIVLGGERDKSATHRALRDTETYTDAKTWTLRDEPQRHRAIETHRHIDT